MRARLGLLVAVLLAVSGCTGTAATHAPSAGATHAAITSEPPLTGPLTVFAAASLTDVFSQLGDGLKQRNPALDLRFNFAGSSALATQISQGAPADVFASADQAQMAVVSDAGVAAGQPRVFASNVLEIAVPPGNPAGITGLADFARPDLALAVCAPKVPCGAAAQRVFALAGVHAKPDTLEEDVRAALTKVRLGEVDAALVYATDVVSAGDAVEGIEFPEAEKAVNEYPITVLTRAPNTTAAHAFVDLVLSDVGQKALAAAGFRTP